jgi:hypothetical protein
MPEGLYRASMLLKPGFPLKQCGNDSREDAAYLIAGVIINPKNAFNHRWTQICTDKKNVGGWRPEAPHAPNLHPQTHSKGFIGVYLRASAANCRIWVNQVQKNVT